MLRIRLFTAVAVALWLLAMTIAPAGATAHNVADVIVVLRVDVDARAAARDAARDQLAEVSFVYEDALKGFAARVPEGRLNALRRDPRVDYIEPNRLRTIQAQMVPTGVQRVFADDNGAIDIDGSDDYRVDVDVAVIDTGIDLEHPELDVVAGVSCFDGGGFPWGPKTCSSGGDDDHYHGTHVAGTVGAIDDGSGVVGVAPGARLHAVKVLDSSGRGYTSNIIAGIDWVTANADAIEVANMSLGGSGYSQSEYDAIQGAVDAGVAFAVAAGNDDDDAGNYSPAAFDNVLTVSALADFDGELGANGSPTCRSDQDDTLADFSNWGSAVQITAPGVCIRSTYPIEKGGYGTISGTSMASPHAAGALALLASTDNPGGATDVQNLYDDVANAGNFDWTDDSGDGSKESLLDVAGFSATLVAGSDGGGGTGDDPPTVDVTNPADGATVRDSIAVTADATDDNDVTQVEFFVDGASIGVDGDGSDGWSMEADTTVYEDGSHAISATATDSAGQTASDQVSVTIDNVTEGISLGASGYKVRGRHHVDLAWSAATSTSVDVVRDGAVLTTTANDGAYTDSTDNRGGASYTYQVCEAGTTACSNEVTVTF